MQIPMTYWKNYPEPYYPGWQSEPVPGWGMRPVMAGPARVGVGATAAAAPNAIQAAYLASLRPGMTALYQGVEAGQQALTEAEQTVAAMEQACAQSGGQWDPETLACSSPTAGTGIPWWVWPIGAAVVLGAIGYVGTKKRWF